MEKIYQISHLDKTYPKGVLREIVDKFWSNSAGQRQVLDIYADEAGKLYYSYLSYHGIVKQVFVPIMKLENRIYFERFEPYLKHLNNMRVVNHSYKDFEALKADILKAMPRDYEMFRVLADGEWGIYNPKTKRDFGVICNASFCGRRPKGDERKYYPLSRMMYDREKEEYVDEPRGFLYRNTGEIFV